MKEWKLDRVGGKLRNVSVLKSNKKVNFRVTRG